MIQIDNVSKLYRLGRIGTGTLSHDLNGWWRKVSGKYNDKDAFSLLHPKPRTELWSLRNISFTVAQGEVCGIVGRNGAGKSTLLKILSKITRPTIGTVRLAGRVASLLEVGTGFHPELTGRENVYLNGAILGMTKAEITRKFDEIIDFSGVEQFIDTPVKRYSSGMYVRLAFAVSAHLEPEILIVDEVLAVGDAEFQQKCIGKMKDVSKSQGRTVLFVSHNTQAIKQLCTTAVLLDHGVVKELGSVESVLDVYQARPVDPFDGRRASLPENLPGFFTDWKLELPSAGKHAAFSRDRCTFSFGFTAKELLPNCEVRLILRQEDGTLIVYASSQEKQASTITVAAGHYRFHFAFDFPVRHGKYKVEVALISINKLVDLWSSGTPLTILDNSDSPLREGLLNPSTSFMVQKTISDLIPV